MPVFDRQEGTGRGLVVFEAGFQRYVRGKAVFYRVMNLESRGPINKSLKVISKHYICVHAHFTGLLGRSP